MDIFTTFSLLMLIKTKFFHFLCNTTQIKRLELPKNFSQNCHLFLAFPNLGEPPLYPTRAYLLCSE